MRLRVEVPASTSNLGSGFDCLGMALDLGMSLEVETAQPGTLEITVAGSETGGVPRDARNASAAALIETLRRRGHPLPGLHLSVENHIPVGRGLGSSAAAIVAGVTAAHLCCGGNAPNRDEIAREAAAIEGHPDNVAAAVHGGLVATCQDSERLMALNFPLPERLELRLLVPALQVPTREARQLLPPQVTRAAAVFNLGRLAMLLGGFLHDDPVAWRLGMEDRLHQRQRLSLCPGLAEALESLLGEPACLAACLSGSGPTLIAFYRLAPAGAGEGAVEILARHGVAASLRPARATARGVTWERHQSP